MDDRLTSMVNSSSENRPLAKIDTMLGDCYIVDKDYVDKIIFVEDGNGIVQMSNEERVRYEDYVLYLANTLHPSKDKEPSKAIKAAVAAVRDGEDIDLCYSVTQVKLIEIGEM